MALLLSLFFAFQVTKPLRRLRFLASHIAQDDLSHRVDVTSRDEVGELAESINVMAETLARNENLRRDLIGGGTSSTNYERL